MAKGTIMAKENMSNAEQFLWFGAARTRFSFSYLAMCLDHAPLTLLSKLRRFLFLVAAGFLSAVLIACAGGGGGGSSGDGGPVNNGSIINVSMDDEPGTDPGNVDPGSGSPSDNDNDGIENADDNCPDVANPRQTDTDGDSEGDACDEDDDNDNVMDGTDIDDDGDGLIEIRTHEELNAVRHQLDGSGRKLLDTGMADTTGCGGTGGITSCSGYELVTNISLAGYVDADNGKGWQPLGHDTNGNTDECDGAAFNGIFEGNGFMISNLNISRPNENCVGLFGHVAANSEIRNLRLSAEAVTGRNRVGGLVGDGVSARIISSSVEVDRVEGIDINIGGLVGLGESVQIFSSSVVAGRVRGTNIHVGGLVGLGRSARIISSSVVVGEVSGTGLIGGLVGFGESVQIFSSSVVVDIVNGGTVSSIGGLVGNGENGLIHSSSVVAGAVRGNSNVVGGLVGWGDSARIYSSSIVVAEVMGNAYIGGLVGWGPSAQIYSSSVVVAKLSRTNPVGGLAGSFGSGKVAYSYVISGSMTRMLVGEGSGDGVDSYWYNATGITHANGNHGEAKTSNELQMPTNYAGIYEDWDKDTDIFGDGNINEPLAVWCDRDNSGNITADEREDDNRIWNFGTNTEYPAIECAPIAPDEWRSWWSLNASGKPELDRARLDDLLQ